MQRVDPPAGQSSHGLGAEIPVIDDHHMADVVDAAPAGPTGQLGELARCQGYMAGAVEFLQLFDNHATSGHVDAQSQGFGGEDHLEQA